MAHGIAAYADNIEFLTQTSPVNIFHTICIRGQKVGTYTYPLPSGGVEGEVMLVTGKYCEADATYDQGGNATGVCVESLLINPTSISVKMMATDPTIRSQPLYFNFFKGRP